MSFTHYNQPSHISSGQLCGTYHGRSNLRLFESMPVTYKYKSDVFKTSKATMIVQAIR
jgi:hypothetical protein